MSMSMKHAVESSCRGAAGQRSPEQLLSDLSEILKSDLSVYLSLGPADAVFAVKSPMTFAFGKVVIARWSCMTPRERAEAVLEWIRDAAKYCRHPRSRYAAADDTVA